MSGVFALRRDAKPRCGWSWRRRAPTPTAARSTCSGWWRKRIGDGTFEGVHGFSPQAWLELKSSSRRSGGSGSPSWKGSWSRR